MHGETTKSNNLGALITMMTQGDVVYLRACLYTHVRTGRMSRIGHLARPQSLERYSSSVTLQGQITGQQRGEAMETI